MDIEDWYHLDYFYSSKCSKEYSMLDGIGKYCELLNEHNIPSSFFVVGELVKSIRATLHDLSKDGNDIASHGWAHLRPMTLSVNQFQKEIIKTKEVIEDAISFPVEGYRAPCFSLNRERLDIVENAGYLYDSSRINFSAHPLYETIDMDSYTPVINNIYRINNFLEFEVTTKKILNRNVPISGGGYIRLLPWFLTNSMIKSYLKLGDLYVLYIHPFELSTKLNPPFPIETKWQTKLRFGMGRKTVSEKLSKLILLLKDSGYCFTTFSLLRKELLSQDNKKLDG
jgi:polysaccharide deacetylase family protein (PEP-CTERM system associated)